MILYQFDYSSFFTLHPNGELALLTLMTFPSLQKKYLILGTFIFIFRKLNPATFYLRQTTNYIMF